MSPEQGKSRKRFLGEARGKDAEEVEWSMSSESSLSSSSNESNQPQQNENSHISKNNFLSSSPMLPRSNVITGASNAQFVRTPLQQSITPNTMDLLPKTEALQPFEHGQDINHNVLRNQQFLLSRHMSMGNAVTSQNRTPYGATENCYNYPTSNLPADCRLDPSSRSQMRIGATPPFIKTQMAQMQQNYQQMADNSDFNPFEPQYGYLQELMNQATGYPSNGHGHQMLLNTAIAQQGMVGSSTTGLGFIHSEVGDSSIRGQKRKMSFRDESQSPSNHDQPFNWFPQGLGEQKPELGCPSTIPRYNLSLYDPAFEAMGLPADPHLRMFLAVKGGKKTDQQK